MPKYHTPNTRVVVAQQVVEKYLKYLVFTFCVENKQSAKKALTGHNLVILNKELLKVGINLGLNQDDLRFLKDWYYTGRYPGDSFDVADEEDANRAYNIVITVKKAAENYMKAEGLCPDCGFKLSDKGICQNANCYGKLEVSDADDVTTTKSNVFNKE